MCREHNLVPLEPKVLNVLVGQLSGNERCPAGNHMQLDPVSWYQLSTAEKAHCTVEYTRCSTHIYSVGVYKVWVRIIQPQQRRQTAAEINCRAGQGLLVSTHPAAPLNNCQNALLRIVKLIVIYCRSAATFFFLRFWVLMAIYKYRKRKIFFLIDDGISTLTLICVNRWWLMNLE